MGFKFMALDVRGRLGSVAASPCDYGLAGLNFVGNGEAQRLRHFQEFGSDGVSLDSTLNLEPLTLQNLRCNLYWCTGLCESFQAGPTTYFSSSRHTAAYNRMRSQHCCSGFGNGGSGL